MEGPGSIPVMTRLLFPYSVQTDSAEHQTFYSMVQGVPSSGVKRLERDVGHSPQTSAQVNTGGSLQEMALSNQ
jgi:hypothetical protein